jgi:type II secretory pathway pseudopilin PulG
MRILVQHGDQRLGPFSVEEARATLAAGTVSPSDLAWAEGSPGWVPLGSLLSAPPPIPGHATAAQAYASAPVKQTSGMAIASLVLGITSVAMCLSFLTGIPAIVLGHLSRSKIRKSGGTLGGEGLALGGLITGYVGSLVLIPVLAALALPVFTAAQEKAKAAKSLNNARQIVSACYLYAAKQEAAGKPGDFPPDLETLFTSGALEESNRRVLQCPLLNDPSAPGYAYFGAKADDREDRVVLVSKAGMRNGKRIVARKGGSAQIEPYDLPSPAEASR